MSHGHSHSHGTVNYNRTFALGVALNVGFILAEVVFGFLSDSLALLADAGHNASDVLGLLLAWGAHYLSQLRPSGRRTYGWRSSSILAALANAVILLIATAAIVWEAIRRFADPVETGGLTVMWVAGAGVLINGVTAWLFFAGRKTDLNVRGAFLHMAADAGVSLAVVIAGLGIIVTGWAWLDPATSIVVALVIVASTWELARDSFNLSLQAVPRDIDLDEVKNYLESLPGVDRVHDLHIWAMSTTENALTAHLVKPTVDNEDALLAEASHALHDRFGISHSTLQIERDPMRCSQACADPM